MKKKVAYNEISRLTLCENYDSPVALFSYQ